MKKPVSLFIFLSFSIITFSQNKIDTDRPDQTESANLVPKKFFQGEFGFNKENYQGSNYIILHPTSLLKYGLHKRIELRLETVYKTEYYQLTPNPEILTGFEPVEIGTKISLFEEKGVFPKTSFIGQVGLPFLASKYFRPDNLSPSFRFTMQHTLTETIGIGYNVGAEWDGESSDPVLIYTLAPGFNIGKKWYAYVELFGFLQERDFQEHNVDGGIAYYISDNIKIDLSAGFGLNNSLKNYIAIGFSFRFNTEMPQ
jgi:hypothetical protein